VGYLARGDASRAHQKHKEEHIVVAAAGDAGKTDIAGRLGIEPGMVVQELGWDSDVDEEVRNAVEERCGDDLVDEDSDEVVDVVLLWWREGDGDLADALIGAGTPLTDSGVVWVLTPKTGRTGHVEPSEIAEAAPLGEKTTLRRVIGLSCETLPRALDRRQQSDRNRSIHRFEIL